MKRYLLDTNVVSEMRKAKPHGAVRTWMSGLQSEQILIPALTFAELQDGVEIIRDRDATKANEIEQWINLLEATAHILPMDARCFREWARLMQHQPDHLSEDGMIAASARIYGLVVATRNEADFRHFDVPFVNPFRPMD